MMMSLVSWVLWTLGARKAEPVEKKVEAIMVRVVGTDGGCKKP